MPQDTVVVALARGSLESATAWITIGLIAVCVAVLVVLVLVLAELRKLSRSWSEFAAATTESVQPLFRHAVGAARSLDQAAEAVRAEVTRATGALGGIATGLDDAAVHLRQRLAEFAALLDLIQSEAEEGVLDAAAKLRILRSGTGLLRRGRKRGEAPEDRGEPPQADAEGGDAEGDDA